MIDIIFCDDPQVVSTLQAEGVNIKTDVEAGNEQPGTDEGRRDARRGRARQQRVGAVEPAQRRVDPGAPPLATPDAGAGAIYSTSGATYSSPSSMRR